MFAPTLPSPMLPPPPAHAAAVHRVAQALVAPTAERANKVLQSSSAPAQRSLFLRPGGAR
jgi:hypothetical protein